MAHDDILVRLEGVVAKWSAEITEAQGGLSDRLTSVRERLDTVAAGHAARTVERAALADAEATVEALKEMVSLREDDLRTAAERSTRLEQRVADLSEHMHALEAGLDEEAAAAHASATDVDALHAQLGEVEERLAQAEQEAEALGQALAQREQELQNAGRRIAQLEERNEDLAEQAASSVPAHELEGVRGQLALVESERDALAQRAAQYEQDALDGAARIEQLEEQAATSAADLAALQAQLADNAEVYKAREEALQAELAQARERLAQAEAHERGPEGAVQAEPALDPADYERLADEVATLREVLAQANGQVLELHRQLAAHPPLGELEELQRILEQERERADLLEGQLHQPRDDADRAALREQLAGALRDRDEAHQEIVSLRTEVDMLRRANAGLTMPATPETTEAEPLPIERLGEDGHKRRMGEILIELGVITPEQLQEAIEEQALTPQRRLGAILVERGYTAEDVVARVLARQLDLPFVRLTEEVVDGAAPRIITALLAKRRMCIPIAVAPDRIVLAMANPFDLVAIEDVERTIDRRVEPAVTTPSDIASALLRYYETT